MEAEQGTNNFRRCDIFVVKTVSEGYCVVSKMDCLLGRRWGGVGESGKLYWNRNGKTLSGQL